MRQESAKVKGKTEQSRAVCVGGGEEYDYVYATWQLLKVQVRPVCVCLVCMCVYLVITHVPLVWMAVTNHLACNAPPHFLPFFLLARHPSQARWAHRNKSSFSSFPLGRFFCLLTCLGVRVCVFVCVYHTIWRPFKVSTLYCILLGARPSWPRRVALRRLLRVFYANQMKLNLYFYAHAQGASTTAKRTTGETRATQAARR